MQLYCKTGKNSSDCIRDSDYVHRFLLSERIKTFLFYEDIRISIIQLYCSILQYLEQYILERIKRLHIKCVLLDNEHLLMLPINWLKHNKVLGVNVEIAQNFYKA